MKIKNEIARLSLFWCGFTMVMTLLMGLVSILMIKTTMGLWDQATEPCRCGIKGWVFGKGKEGATADEN